VIGQQISLLTKIIGSSQMFSVDNNKYFLF